MNNEVLLNAFEQMANNNKYINSVNNCLFHRDDLGISINEKEYIRRCVRFRIHGIGEALTKIISTFQKVKYEYCELNNSLTVIKKKGTAVPGDKFRSNKDYIVLAICRNDRVSFYTFCKEFCVASCDNKLDYPFPYIKEFIDEVIKFRIKYGIMDIDDYGLEYLATEFIKAREEQLEVGSGARVRSKKSSQ